MNNVYRFAAVFLAVTAIVQLLGIGERVHHALWQWFKFYGYSNDGHTTLDALMVVFTFGFSIFAIFMAWLICKFAAEQSWATKVAMYSGISCCLGLALLSALVISPLAQVVLR